MLRKMDGTRKTADAVDRVNCVTPSKTKMTMETQPSKDGSLLLKLVILHCHVGFRGGGGE